MDTLLVPVDFSTASSTAGNYAASLAKAFTARLTLLHVYMMPAPVTEVPYMMVSVNELQNENEHAIRREADNLHQHFGIEVETRVQIGMPSDEITAAARECGAALVVIGSRGAGALDKLLGSTSSGVVRKALSPVLVVPQHAVFQPVREIVYASDFSYCSSPDLLRPLLQIATIFRSKIHIVHIRKAGSNDVSEKELTAKNMISGLLASTPHEFSIITDESITHGINQFVEKNQAQMLVMVAHKHGFFDRLFNKIHTVDMAYQTKIPLLVLHDG